MRARVPGVWVISACQDCDKFELMRTDYSLIFSLFWLQCAKTRIIITGINIYMYTHIDISMQEMQFDLILEASLSNQVY